MKKILKKGFGGFVWALLLAVVLAVALDLAAAVFWQPLPRLPWLVGAGLLFVLLALLPVRRQALRWDFFAALFVLALSLLLSHALLGYLQRSGAYADEDRGKSALYGGQRVLVVVPREGDELRLAAGALEAYAEYGSELAVLYTEGSAEERTVAEALGIPPAQLFSRERLSAVLDAVQPTVILAARDAQRALTEALRDRADKPTVLYGLLWDEPDDFYAEPLRSTQDPGWYARSGFDWNTRLRLPAAPSALSHALSGCRDYTLLRLTGLDDKAEGVINGDCVFWPAAGESAAVSFVKLCNQDGDFLYDYFIDPLGRETLPLYTCGEADQPYQVSVSGERCTAKIAPGRVLEVLCPKGRSCLVTVTSADGRFSDTVRISNPGRFARETAQSLERRLLAVWDDRLPKSNCFQLLRLLEQ